MKKSMQTVKKIMAIVLFFSMFAQQAGFAQIAGQVNLGGYLGNSANTVKADKFQPLHLRYFSYNSLQSKFKLILDKGSRPDVKNAELSAEAKTLFNYFLTGINLPNETFWVNLRPDSSDQIIDAKLGRTDMGKVLLEADLQLKKDTAAFTSPNSNQGKIYWNKLYKKAAELFGSENITIPTLTRPWIVPGEVIISYSNNGAYIYKANLKVMLEQDYLANGKSAVVNGADYSFKDPRQKELNEYSSQLIRELIIPQLTKEVNTGKRYAALRQVFYSLVLAQWFKARYSANHTSAYAKMINSGNLSGLVSQNSWDKNTYFKQYQKSFAQGEYNVKEPVSTPSGQVIRSYFSGGVELGAPEVGAVPGLPSRVDLGAVEFSADPSGLTPADGSASVEPSEPGDSTGFEGWSNAAYNGDINAAVRPPRKHALTSKWTIPYAKDNRVYRTAQGRRDVAQHMREVLDEVELHIRTVVFGKNFSGGRQVVGRTSTDANLGWTDEILEQDPVGTDFLLQQKDLTQVGIPQLMSGDYRGYVQAIRDYVDTRSGTSRQWLRLILAARRGEKGLPAWAYARAKNIAENPEAYKTFIALFEQFDNGLEDPETYDLYAPDEIGRAVQAAKDFSQRTGLQVAVFAFGAGGFGSVCGVAGESPEAVDQFLREYGVPQLITPEQQAAGMQGLLTTDAEAIVSGTGQFAEGTHKLAFWVDAKADVDGVLIGDSVDAAGKIQAGLASWNEAPVLQQRGIQLRTPQPLPWVLVNKDTLEERPLAEDEDVDDSQYGDEWIVARSWEVSFDHNQYFRFDRPVLDPQNLELINQRIQENGFQGVWSELWAYARATGKRIYISAPARWLDTLGSSWDLLAFRLEGTPEGDLRLNILPACNAVPSEYRLEIEVTAIDDLNVVEYVAEQYFQGVHRVNPNELQFVDHPDAQRAAQGIKMLAGKEKDLPAFFAKLFGISGGIRFTCSKMSFVPRQGGMESSNIFTDTVAAILNMLSGANLSVADVSHISLLAQTSEGNNLTGNQGADAAWAGAGLHIYKGGLYDMQAKRNFAAVAVRGMTAHQVPLLYVASHPVWKTTNYSVPVEQQGVQLSFEQLSALELALGLLPREVRDALQQETIVFLSFANGATAHRSLGREQIEIDLSLLEHGRENDLANRLWHEIMEKNLVLGALHDLGLAEQFEHTRLEPRVRETTLVQVGGQEIALSEVINNISLVVHQALIDPAVAEQRLGTAAEIQEATGIDFKASALGQSDRQPPAAPGSTGAPAAPGGIDFRFINIMAMPKLDTFKANIKLPALNQLKKADIAKEKASLEKMMQSGVSPSSQRVMEYLAACYSQQKTQDANRCLTSYLRLQEESVNPVGQEFMAFLFLLKSGKL